MSALGFKTMMDPLLACFLACVILRVAELDKHQTSKPVIVSVVSSIPAGSNFIFC